MTQNPKEVVGILETILLKNPVLKLCNRLIESVPLLADLSNHFGSIFLKSISTNWQKLLVLAGATAITATSILYLKRIYFLLNILVKHKLNQANASAKQLK